MTVTRLGTANTYDRTINNIGKQQADLANQMEHASAGKRVIRASDDPVAAAQAERARTRMSRIETDQRTLDAQTATVKYGESSLGEIYAAVQEFRSLLVQAGNGTYNQTQRDTLVEQLQSLRDQIQTYSNRKDSNGLPLFRGLDTLSSTPFPNGTSGIQAGQTNSGEYSITNSLNGALAFFSGVTGNGSLTIESGAAVDPATVPPTYTPNQGKAWSTVGTIVDASAASNQTVPLQVEFFYNSDEKLSYRITSNGTAIGLNDSQGKPLVDNTDPLAPQPILELPYEDGADIFVSGMMFSITGVPHADANTPGITGDVFTITPSTPASVFDVLDQAIASVKNAGNADGTTKYGDLAHAMAKAEAEIDTQLNRISTVRGLAGDLLNQAERMGTTLLGQEELMESQRSAAEDIDMVKALSQLKTQEVAVSAALQSYSSIQKLSLFNFIN